MNLHRYTGAFIGIVIILAVILAVDYREVGALFLQIKWQYALAVPFVFLGIYFVQTLRFLSLLQALHDLPPLLKTYQVVLSGVIVNTISPGGGGDIVSRPYLMRHLFGTPVKPTFAATITERLFDLGFLLLNALLAAAIIFPSLLVLIGICFVVAMLAAATFLYLPMNYLPLPGKLKKLLVDVRIIKTIPLRLLVGTALFNVVTWALLYGAFALSALAFNVPPTLALLAAFALSFVVGVLSFIPGGLGSNEASMTALLALQGYEASLGVSISLLVRILNILPALILSFPLVVNLLKQPYATSGGKQSVKVK